jgi:hypothetical protein
MHYCGKLVVLQDNMRCFLVEKTMGPRSLSCEHVGHSETRNVFGNVIGVRLSWTVATDCHALQKARAG